jgi:hypothetical protein
MAMKVKNV